ncbi:SPFH domain-containing protein [Suttonella ornithocola]|uniref:FtsH protease regulator HflK n=1 Tax=Suttonella ornithocola TaxID=279832 RepID=A0A380MW57_9GAMM|nr:prohibitin family protein [Suttonella ornithocola]SUO96799.1 FtsH protease regulator HflK [Suttonella ornithocola]
MNKFLPSVISFSVVGLIVLSFTGGTVYTIDQGERGVVLSYGQVKEIAEPGLHFKLPFVNKVIKIPVRTTTGTLDKVLAYSSDQQPAEINVSVTLSVADTGVDKLYSQFGNLEDAYQRVIVPLTRQEIKTVFGQYTALKAVQTREQLNHDVQEAVTRALSPYSYLKIHSVQIENIDFSDAYEQTIEDRMKAEVEVERYKQNLEREKVEAEIAVTRAKASADARVKAAEGEAKAITLRADAEAKAITQKADALKQNSDIIHLMQVERWDGKLPSTMLPNNVVPILSSSENKN